MPSIIKLILFFSIFLFSCKIGVDTTKDFAMRCNGGPYKIKLGECYAKIKSHSTEMNQENQFSVIFPLKHMNQMQNKGFELVINPLQATLGDVMHFHTNDNHHGWEFTYQPNFGHHPSEQMKLIYSSHMGTGFIKVRFDQLEAKINGRIKGIILEAVLFGYYEKETNTSIIKPKIPQKLELFNFPFDTTFRSAIY